MCFKLRQLEREKIKFLSFFLTSISPVNIVSKDYTLYVVKHHS